MLRRLVLTRRAPLVLVVATALLATTPTISAVAEHGVSRQSRFSHVAIAGGDILLWSRHRSVSDNANCTLSFAVSTTAGEPGALTAGHCVALLPGRAPYTVHQTKAQPHGGTDPGAGLGTVSRGDYYMGRRGDSAFIRLSADRRASARVFTGGSTSGRSVAVAGVLSPRLGLHVCYSGARTGEHCGFRISARPRTVDFGGRHQRRIGGEWSARRASCPARSGDSGAAVYVKRNDRAYAVGTLSGGGGDGSCPLLFTSIRRTLRLLHLQLLTSR